MRGRKQTRATGGDESVAQRRWPVAAIGFVAVVALLAAGGWWWGGQQRVTTDDAYVEGNRVPVTMLTDGVIERVVVEDTQYVHAGQALLVLQADRSRLRLNRAEARLGVAVREVRRQFAQVRVLHRRRDAARATLHRLQADLERYEKAVGDGAVSAKRLQDGRLQVAEARAKLHAASAASAAAEAAVSGTSVTDNPQVRAARAEVERRDLDWQRRVLRAPVSGFVARRTAYPGRAVHSGQTLFEVVPLDDLWVVANVKETLMRSVRPGQRVRLTSDYYGSSVQFEGRVEGLLPGAGSAFSVLPPENATGNYIHIVERVPVRISLAAADLRRHPLRPGLSMQIAIDTTAAGPASGLLQPLTTVPAHGYQTAIYRQQRQHARRLARAVIERNR
jgi:Multidrug resistance efflux pump